MRAPCVPSVPPRGSCSQPPAQGQVLALAYEGGGCSGPSSAYDVSAGCVYGAGEYGTVVACVGNSTTALSTTLI